MEEWIGHARDTLATLGCSVTAKEIADRLREQGDDIGVASIYRTLDLLDRLRLARRVDAGEGVARYEPIDPSGEHHHHLVCGSCGEVRAFEDRELERTIERLSRRGGFTIHAHGGTLSGE